MFPWISPPYIVAFLFGSTIGSFANVCIHRLPWKQSLAFPPSHCPFCQELLRPWHNIPLLSYLALRGRCAFCNIVIPVRYPMIECLCGLLYIMLYNAFGLSLHSVILALLVTALVIVSFIDLDHKIIPDAITLTGIPLGILTSLVISPVSVWESVLGVILGGGLFFFIAVISSGGMGGGDIKLMATLGAFIGWQSILITIFLASCLGSMVGLALILIKKKNRKDVVPFGPFIALGALITIFYEQNLLSWYLHI